MVDRDCFVSVVVPLHDDRDIIADFVRDILSVLSRHYSHYELVLVDDGSTDDTAAAVRDLLQTHGAIRLIRLSRSFGQEIAISAGLDSVIGDFTVVMLPATDPPDLIPEMVDYARAGAGVVFGIRRSRAAEPWAVRTGARLFYLLASRLLDLRVPANTTHFRVLSRQAVNALVQIHDRSRYLRTLSQYVGYQNQSVPYDEIQRRQRPRHKSLREAIALAANITFSNSLRPLRAAAIISALAALSNALYLGYVVTVYFAFDEVAAGWTTQSFTATAMFLVLFTVLAVMCEYLGRLLEATKDRPLYYVAEESQSRVDVRLAAKRNVVTESHT